MMLLIHFNQPTPSRLFLAATCNGVLLSVSPENNNTQIIIVIYIHLDQCNKILPKFTFAP